MARSLSSRLSWRRRHIAPNALLHPLDPAILSLVKSLVSATKDIACCKKSHVSQRANVKIICRRVIALSSLFEEVRDSGVWIPPSALVCFRQIRAAFRNIKVLIDGCRDGSKLLLLMEHDVVANQFHQLTQDLASALALLPCELLEVADETREQVSLVENQARKAKLYLDRDEKELHQEVLAIMTEFERGACPLPEKLRHIFRSLSLNDAKDCERELVLLEKEREQLRSKQQTAEIPNINSLMSFVRYARCVLYGLVPEEDQVTSSAACYEQCDVPVSRKVVFVRDEEGGGAGIPEEFLCPISLELMVDPVIVASGQTYERAAIERWLEEGHTTCPKTGLKLFHNFLVPNSNLRRLITQWCLENDFVLEPAPEKPGNNKSNRAAAEELPITKAALEATKLTAEFLLERLARGGAEVKRQAAQELRKLAKDGMEERKCIGEAGAVPHLVLLLSSEDAKTQENAVTALLNLSIHEENKGRIMEAEGAVDGIIEVARSGGSMEARENAAAALFSLAAAAEAEYKVLVGSRPGCIEALVGLLTEGTPRGQRDASATLVRLAPFGHGAAMVAHGAVPAAMNVLRAPADVPFADALALLAALARLPDGAAAVRDHAVAVGAQLVAQVVRGSGKAPEGALAVLVAACAPPETRDAASLRRQLRQSSSLVPALQRLLVSGTSRAQRKAASLLKILQLYP